MTVHDYALRCEELFALGGYAQVRAAAGQGLAEAGPDPVLQRWLGLAHAAEEDDDHDAEAEAVYKEGLRRRPDDLGLLVSYLELCLRADAWENPGRKKRAESLKVRIAELAPPGSPEAQQVEAAMGWAGRGYWEDIRAETDRAHAERDARASLSADVGRAVSDAAPAAAHPEDLRAAEVAAAHPEDLRAAEVAAALEVLSGPWNAPLRLVQRYRVASYAAAIVLAIVTNKVLVGSGAVSFSVWGWLWYLPLLLAELKLRHARQLARERVIAAVEARHALDS
ncbi:hypothetical protein ACFRI7_02365 [Streptomyces sp. NPDC056716]|uniref:hypothetical protein n=1 Tax=unclassified Streptomyces TaxID=2593676 RepID=UPI00368DBB4D